MPGYKTIDEFDKEWEEKNKSNAEEEEIEEEEEIVEEEIEEEELLEEDELDLLGDTVFDVETAPETSPEPDKKNKKDYAFGQLRKENKEYKEKVSKLEERNKELEELATNLGYKNAEEMLEYERKRKVEKEAKEKGIDPVFYQELRKTQEELEQIKRERANEIKNSKLQKFTNELNNVFTEYSFTEQEQSEIIQEMENDGYDLDDLLAIKAPRRFIIGYAKDKIVDREVQKKIKTSKNDFKEDKFNKVKEETVTEKINEIIEQEMKEYAKMRGINSN